MERQSDIKKKIIIICTILIVLFVVIASSMAWYRYENKDSAVRENIEVMTPYFLYLLNADGKTSLQFAVGNLHPSETKQIIICVSNKKPENLSEEAIDIAKESDFDYDLGILYTENLAVNYNIYELDAQSYTNPATIPQDAIVMKDVENVYWMKRKNVANQIKPLAYTEDVSEARHLEAFGKLNEVSDIVNSGKYLLYNKDTNDLNLHLTYSNNQYDYDYYLVEIVWDKDIEFDVYKKETDLLYVLVNAKQPKPELLNP